MGLNNREKINNFLNEQDNPCDGRGLNPTQMEDCLSHCCATTNNNSCCDDIANVGSSMSDDGQAVKDIHGALKRTSLLKKKGELRDKQVQRKGLGSGKKRKKEQTTSGAAGAYSQPLFGKPIKRKIAERTNSITIKESELINLIEKSIYSAKHGGVIQEALTDADEKRIGVLARKELKDYETKLEKKVEQMLAKSFKSKDFEDATVKIAKNAIVQLYKALWIKRSFWTGYISNTSS
jgi:hypothetical protein